MNTWQSLGFLLLGGFAVIGNEPLKPLVVWIPSPNYDDRPAGAVIDTIVIHDTETPGIRSARTIASHFANPRSGVSAHFIIGKGGEIVQCVDEAKRAFHAGPSLFRGRSHVNDFSIGIELVNAQTGRDPFTI
ncbi:MAG: N-acetylmuramoyl-L-alanine amidase [Cyanobacteria bacterium NC_groundwater_1444_Ag_S-0.65um_54_12]|nr:N-acetylmuramoyl-L-alanine amidase [Cyanobacteria bacterium NC_groundwater_1444_Ag_S-0.65um_54_12]